MSDDLHDKTNAELDRMAIAWMGWDYGEMLRLEWTRIADGTQVPTWSPTTSWEHAGEMLERLAEISEEIGMRIKCASGPPGQSIVNRCSAYIKGGTRHGLDDTSLKRAIVLACLATKEET